jgi:hypothetical protein
LMLARVSWQRMFKAKRQRLPTTLIIKPGLQIM